MIEGGGRKADKEKKGCKSVLRWLKDNTNWKKRGHGEGRKHIGKRPEFGQREGLSREFFGARGRKRKRGGGKKEKKKK